MSKAGQSVFTGISAQADIALLFLLENFNKPSFRQMIVEGSNWEDFTLVFQDHNEDFEVKWLDRPLSYGDVKQIVHKELKKKLGENDKLKIIGRELSNTFKKDYEYIKGSLYWSRFYKEKEYEQNPIYKRFLKKRWTNESVSYLINTEIIEIANEKSIEAKILGYFAVEDPFYLDRNDQKRIAAVCFKEILQKGATGGSISKHQFIEALEDFKRSVAIKSESFSPELPIKNTVYNIDDFITSEQNFKALNDSKYLTPISSNRRLVFYILDKLEKNDFAVESFDFFIETVLRKKFYALWVIFLLERKWKRGKANPGYLLNFISKYFKSLFYESDHYTVLGLVKDIAESDKDGKYEKEIIQLLQKDILKPFLDANDAWFRRHTLPSANEEAVIGMIKLFYNKARNKKDFVDFIFSYFNFTEDYFQHTIDTNEEVYGLVREFIEENFEKNFGYALEKIIGQFNLAYSGRFKGYEWSGGGISISGSEYTLTDRGIVRFIFKPLFGSGFYVENLARAWKFFRREILDKPISKKNPTFLKRALIGLLIDRIENETFNKALKEESFEYLKDILKLKKGPETSEFVFDELRNRDVLKVGGDRIMSLIRVDSEKYKSDTSVETYPSNVFVIFTLFRLIQINFEPAKQFFLELVQKPDFVRRDQWYESFELLSAYGIPKSDPDFIVKVFDVLNFEDYLNKSSDSFRTRIWEKSGVVSGLVEHDWDENTDRGKRVIDYFLKGKRPSEHVLQFISGILSQLSKTNALKTYELFAEFLNEKKAFRQTFENNSYPREEFVRLAEELAKNGHFEEAKTIIELCIDDPNPETHNREEDYNYHLQVKHGKDVGIITTVRGYLCWAIQKLMLKNNPDRLVYALEKTEMLLDLDGKLAKELGYPEPDYYVRSQAIVPLIELAHPARRGILENYSQGLGNKVKNLAFKIIGVLDRDAQLSNANPVAIASQMVRVFDFIRDLNTEDAQRVLTFFEKYGIEESYFLFIYFAIYRLNQYKEVPFEAAYFRDKLKSLCTSNDEFREKLAWYFWRVADEKSDDKRHFNEIEGYWKLLFHHYQNRVFGDLYRTLEVTLTWPEKYDSHKELLKVAIQKEVEFYKTKGEGAQLWDLRGEIFEILKEHDVNDFLEVFSVLLRDIDEKFYFYSMKEWIGLFRSLDVTDKSIDLATYKEIASKLAEWYPEDYRLE